MEKATHADAVKTRVCRPKWKGLKFIPKLARHFNDEWITDAEATSLLDAGFLKPEDFTVLPGEVYKPAAPAAAAPAAVRPRAKQSKKIKK